MGIERCTSLFSKSKHDGHSFWMFNDDVLHSTPITFSAKSKSDAQILLTFDKSFVLHMN
jgi:hypothetical protein